MAVVRARSSPPYRAFAGFFLFGLAAVMAVAFYFMWAKSVDDVKTAKDGSARAGTTANQATEDLGKIRTQLAAAVTERDGAKDQARSKEDALQAAEARATGAQATSKQAAADLQKAREGFAQQIASLNEQIVKLNADITKANRERDAAIAKGEEALNKEKASSDDARRDLVLQVEQDKSELAKAQAEIMELRQRLIANSGRQGNPNAGEADSTVVRVNQATLEAYILLGKKTRVVPGLTFTAYDPRLGVRFGTDDLAQGNGSMEVIEVGETTSLCRITRTTPGKAIQAGDLISNIVYHNDRTRLFRFVVRGDFDLDGDGVATAAERDRIVRLIVSWGGQVDDKVTSQTDYLVTGAKPTSIASVDEAPASSTEANSPAAPEPGSVADLRKKEQDDYDDVIVQAKRLAIPVLNANRFLAMIGYYNTTIVRYGAASK